MSDLDIQDAVARGAAEMELHRRGLGDPGDVRLTPEQTQDLAQGLEESGPAPIPGVTPARSVEGSQLTGNEADTGVVRRVGAPPTPVAPGAQMPGMGTITVGRPQRVGGRRPNPQAWQNQERTARRYEIAYEGIARSAQGVRRASEAQARSTAAGIQRVEDIQAANEERRNEMRSGMESAYADYLDRVRQVEETQALDPGRLWARMETPARIMSSIAVGLQGLARMFGRPVENGAIQRLQGAVRQDLELQQEEYQRNQQAAEMRGNIYAQMRQRFQDEQQAMEMAEAAAWRVIQGRITGYSNLIQNENVRNRLGLMATQAGERADRAAAQALQARAREIARSRPRTMVPLTVQTPQGPQQIMVSPRRLERTLLEGYEQQLRQAGQRQDPHDTRADQAAINLYSRGTGLRGAQNTIAIQQEFRSLVRDLMVEQGVPASQVDMPGFNPMRALVGDGRLRRVLMDRLEDDPRGSRLRQLVGLGIFNWIKNESGAHFTDSEFARRYGIMAGDRMTPQQILTGVELLSQANTNSLRQIRTLSPGVYQYLMRNSGIDYDPIAAVDYNQGTLNDLFGGRAPGALNAGDRNGIRSLLPSNLLSEWDQLGRNQSDPSWLQAQERRRPRQQREEENAAEDGGSSTGYGFERDDLESP